MARKRASMREGPLAELFKKTEAARRSQEEAGGEPEAPARSEASGPDRRAEAALEETVEHVHDFEKPEAQPPITAAAVPPV